MVGTVVYTICIDFFATSSFRSDLDTDRNDPIGNHELSFCALRVRTEAIIKIIMLILLIDFLSLWVAISFFPVFLPYEASRICKKYLWQFSFVEGIFNYYYSFLQDSAMKLVHAERNGEAFDSQLVIGKNYLKITVHGRLKNQESIKVSMTHSCVSTVSLHFNIFSLLFREIVLIIYFCFCN
jgi:hypothetical protein